ncbi:hypothetical protein F442_14602 [Phytophthora nicotianae P10297]|uniref:Crinkler effector protein N-terminal domain-containing protein n=2 Tax=Phytophthora nicotianae TaxID=4792 RepID=W2YRY2_PHYNI|nr:hypothetical protein F444_14765 [Phytophthora nicotianae P1976]ETP37592.1 hypothetical protein F442_14602 [Phytophthora nicotianae P10297]
MKLICLILGAGSATFPVDMNAPNDIVGDLKKAILQEKRNDLAGIDPDRLDLFLARKEEKSGCRTSKTSHLLKNGLLSQSWTETELNPLDELQEVFTALPKRVVHVLVRLPQDVEAKMRDELGLTEVRKTRLINQIRHQIKIEQREAEDERREAEKAEEETERIRKIPIKRKRDWDELNDVLKSKRGKDGSTAFSAMEYGQLPKRFRTDEGCVESGAFYDLMNKPNGLTDNTLDDLLKEIEKKNRVYQDPTSNEATRIQFMSAIFESVVYMFKTDEQRVRLQAQATLTGNYVRSNGVVDFLITRGKKTVCVVEAKDWQFKKGSAQSVLGMEVAADTNEEEVVYGVVTNYAEWRFLKRTDDGIERFDDCIHYNGKYEDDVKRVAGRLYAILRD